jgi:3-oxoacyl-[acyl-carrier protein] reductase
MVEQLKGRVAVITGAGRGIGRAVAIAYAGEGCAVCCFARTESEVATTVSYIDGRDGKAMSRITDVTDYGALEKSFETASDTFGGVDIVVVNAGVSSNATVETGDPAEWQQVLHTNLVGAYHTAKAAIPHLKARGGGKIIFIGSGLGHRGLPGTSAYACSKAGVWSLTRILAQELITENIAVNELIPGPVRTAINKQDDEELRAQLGQNEWIKAPEEVAPMALFLATQPDSGPTAQSFSLMRRDT